MLTNIFAKFKLLQLPFMKNVLVLILFSVYAVGGFCQTSSAFTEPVMVFVEGGSFTCGSNSGEPNEQPVHTVTLPSFYIGKYEVTQGLWQSVLEANPSFFKSGNDYPLEEANPALVDSFIVKLNQLTGKHYRLPTEAEWEYAAMGGNKSKGYRYPGSDSLQDVAWFKDNAAEKTHPVGQKKPNELGVYDMAGNVWELCADWWNPNYYKHSPSANPLNSKKALFRVTRGGSWRSGEERCYNKARNRNIYDHHKQNCGLRLVLDK